MQAGLFKLKDESVFAHSGRLASYVTAEVWHESGVKFSLLLQAYPGQESSEFFSVTLKLNSFCCDSSLRKDGAHKARCFRCNKIIPIDYVESLILWVWDGTMGTIVKHDQPVENQFSTWLAATGVDTLTALCESKLWHEQLILLARALAAKEACINTATAVLANLPLRDY